MASKNPRSIHHAMLHCSWVEDSALRRAGLSEKDLNTLPQRVTFADPEFPLGPCALNSAELRARYSEES